jgi:hypothetical protein
MPSAAIDWERHVAAEAPTATAEERARIVARLRGQSSRFLLNVRHAVAEELGTPCNCMNCNPQSLHQRIKL